MKYVMDIREILQFLPHRYPFLLIDGITKMELGKTVEAIKNVTINEAFFNGHFPGRPVMPGVLMVEALAQAGAVLAYKTTHCSPKDGVIFYFATIENAKFRRIVEPGDQLQLKVNVLRMKTEVWKLEGFVYVNDELVCSSEFMSARKIEKLV